MSEKSIKKFDTFWFYFQKEGDYETLSYVATYLYSQHVK